MTDPTGTEGQGQDQGGQEAPQEQEKSVFERYREKLDAGERIFARQDEEGEEAPPPVDAELESAPEADATPEAAVGEEEPPEELEEAPEAAQEGEEGEEETPEGGEEGEEELVVALPGRNPGEEFEIVAEDKETKDALNRLRKGYLRREALNAAMQSVQADRQEIEEIDTAMATDPAGFLLDKVGKDYRVEVARALIMDDEVWDSLQEEILEAEDPERREVIRLKSEKQRREAAQERGQEVQKVRAIRSAVRRLGNEVVKLSEQIADDAQAQEFLDRGLEAAQYLMERRGRTDITREDLVAQLQRDGLISKYGLNTNGSARPASKGAGAGTARGSASASTPGAGNGQGSEAGTGAAQTAARLKKASRRRKAVAGSASSGAGAPAATVELSKSKSVKDRIEEVRKKGLGNVLQGKS